MSIEKKIANAFNLTDENWIKHSNPWSVWTRFTVLPLIVFAFWIRIWMGWWCLIPVTISLFWMFYNPVIFSKPKSTKNWASKSVLGERVYINRSKIDIPKRHKNGIYWLLNLMSSIGLIMTIWAIIIYSVWGVVFGTFLTLFSKGWYLDRMVWLYEDMKNTNQEYKSWEY